MNTTTTAPRTPWLRRVVMGLATAAITGALSVGTVTILNHGEARRVAAAPAAPAMNERYMEFKARQFDQREAGVEKAGAPAMNERNLAIQERYLAMKARQVDQHDAVPEPAYAPAAPAMNARYLQLKQRQFDALEAAAGSSVARVQPSARERFWSMKERQVEGRHAERR